MAAGQVGERGRAWALGDRVVLSRGWLGHPAGSRGTIIDWIPRTIGDGCILFVEWDASERRTSIEDDLVESYDDVRDG